MFSLSNDSPRATLNQREYKMPKLANELIVKDMNTREGWDFNVVQERMPMPERFGGGPSNVIANIREDNGAILGTVSESYGLVQNSTLIDRAEEAFATRNLTPTSRQICVGEGGKRLSAVYDFKNEVIKLPTVGEELGFRLMITNSFDTSRRVRFVLGALRLICTNGMVGEGAAAFDLLKKHSVKTAGNIENLLTADALNKSLDAFHKSGETWDILSRMEITHEQGLNILQNLTGPSKALPSERIRNAVATVWGNPTHAEDNSRNVWNLYNAATQYITHDLGQDRFEYADEVGRGVHKAFTKIAKSERELERVLKPVAVPALQKN